MANKRRKRTKQDNIIYKPSNFIDDWENKRINYNTKRTVKIVAFVSVFILACVITIYVNVQKDYNQEVTLKDPIASQTPAPSPTSDKTDAPSVFLSNEFYNALYDYENVVAWLEVPNTKINSPIVQTDNDTYYISRNYKQELSPGGALFMYSKCDSEMSKHLTIQGNFMDDGSRFGVLEEYLSKEFFNNNKIIYLELHSGKYEFEVFSVHFANLDYDFSDTEFRNDLDYLGYISMFQTSSKIKNDIALSEFDRVLTLATPYTEMEEGYLLVHAKLILSSD